MKRNFLAVLVFLQACSYHLGPFASSETHFEVGQIQVRVANPEVENALSRAAATSIASRRGEASKVVQVHFELLDFDTGPISPLGSFHRVSLTLLVTTDAAHRVTVQGARQFPGSSNAEQTRLNQTSALQALAQELTEEAVVRLTLQAEKEQ